MHSGVCGHRGLCGAGGESEEELGVRCTDVKDEDMSHSVLNRVVDSNTFPLRQVVLQ